MSDNEQLKVASLEQIKEKFEHQQDLDSEHKALAVSKADTFVGELLAKDLSQLDNQQATVKNIEFIGHDAQQTAARKLAMLKHPIGELSRRAEDGGEIVNALLDLKLSVEALDPAKISLSPGWFTRLLGYIPGIGTPIKRYLSKFESAQTTIEAIAKSLENGREQLKRDNTTLQADQKSLWESEKEVEEQLHFAKHVDEKIENACEKHENNSPEQVKFIKEYMLFPVRQRIIDLQQQLAVQQQSIIASEIIIRNNKELIRGVDRALNVTINALSSATTIAMALAHQEKVITKIDQVNTTTSKLLKDTAERLKTQGTQIHKQAASAQLDTASLKAALSDIKAALDDISTFRQEALPQMKNAVQELDSLIDDTRVPLEEVQKTQQQND